MSSEMSPLRRQCVKSINTYVEAHDGNWKQVRIDVLRDIDLLFQQGGIGHKALAYVLDDVYRQMAPPEAFKATA